MVYGILNDKDFACDVIVFSWVDIILTLNPYYPKSKMAAIACLNAILTIFVNCAAL